MITKATDIRLISLFTIGQRVSHKEFTDCFGEFHPAVHGLTVREINVVNNSCPHVRLTAYADNGWQYHEASQRFFVAE